MPVNPFKWKHYEGEIILLNVRWYSKYALSGSVAKIIFLHFDTIIFTFVCFIFYNKNSNYSAYAKQHQSLSSLNFNEQIS